MVHLSNPGGEMFNYQKACSKEMMVKGKIPLHLCTAFVTGVGKHFTGRNMMMHHGNLLKVISNTYSLPQ